MRVSGLTRYCSFIALLAAMGASFTFADTKVTVVCVDGTTGKPTPASLCITDERGKVRLPPDGRVMQRPSHTRDFYRGVSHDPGPAWIGPVRKMQGLGDNDDRSYVYQENPSVPWWPEPVSFLVNGRTEINLPAGRWQIAAERGSEHIPARKTFETSGSGESTIELTLKRWIDLPAQGWWSGDVHVHHPTAERTHRDFLLAYAQGADIHVVNVLAMGHHRGVDFQQAGFGRKHRVNDGNYWLVSGQEDPRSNFGHIIGLNIESMVRDLNTYDFYDLTFDGIHRQQGALVGFAHFSWNGCSLPRGFPWYVTTEDLDFVELMQFGVINSADYYDYLNLGFRLTAAAGSDIPWGSLLGEVRTYVYCGEKLTPDAWFAGLKQGRSFVSNGPALSFTVNGRLPGAQIDVSAGDKVSIIASAECHPAIGELDSLTLAGADGYTLATRELRDGKQMELRLDRKIERSQWLTVRAKCKNGALAHSSPVYIVVDNEPTWSPRLAARIINEQLQSIARIEAEFQGKNDLRSRGILKRLHDARKWYEQRVRLLEQPPKR